MTVERRDGRHDAAKRADSEIQLTVDYVFAMEIRSRTIYYAAVGSYTEPTVPRRATRDVVHIVSRRCSPKTAACICM